MLRLRGLNLKLYEKIRNVFTKVGERTNLTEYESKRVLSLYGLPVTNFRLARTKEDALRASEEIGYPIALKVVSPDIIHKTEAGIVQLDLGNQNAVAAAYDTVVAKSKAFNPAANIHGVLIERMIEDGTEVIVGMKRDEVFGPAILFGLGGVFVETLKDISLRVVPLSHLDSLDMIKEIKGYSLLTGFRGSKPRDIDSVVSIIMKLAEFSQNFKEVLEVDLNPVLVGEEGKGSAIADARIMLSKSMK